jgi:predicted amidohydrolase
MICFDREFPESARILMLKGAEIILTPNACNLDDRRLNQFQSRAFENSVAVAMTNYSDPLNGHSCAFDAEGDEILIAGSEEGIFLVEFDIEKIRNFRKRTSWGNAYRRPQKYGVIGSMEVDSVFIRNNGKGEFFDRSAR